MIKCTLNIQKMGKAGSLQEPLTKPEAQSPTRWGRGERIDTNKCPVFKIEQD